MLHFLVCAQGPWFKDEKPQAPVLSPFCVTSLPQSGPQFLYLTGKGLVVQFCLKFFLALKSSGDQLLNLETNSNYSCPSVSVRELENIEMCIPGIAHSPPETGVARGNRGKNHLYFLWSQEPLGPES